MFHKIYFDSADCMYSLSIILFLTFFQKGKVDRGETRMLFRSRGRTTLLSKATTSLRSTKASVSNQIHDWAEHNLVLPRPAPYRSLRMSSLPVSELCLLNFLKETANVTDWYMLGVYMGVPPKDLMYIEKQSSGQGSARCRTELFGVWMKRTPNASWELIAAALVELGETVLAEKVRTRYAVLVPSPLASSSSSTVRVVLDKGLVLDLSTLEREFASLFTNLKMSLKGEKVSLKELESFLDIRLDLDGELSQVANIDALLQQIRPHFCLFNIVILKDIIEKFIGKPMKQQLEEYESKLEKFTETATLFLLKGVEFLSQSSSVDMPKVIFKLTGFWPNVTIKRFQRFVDHVFEANSSVLTHIQVKQGCICVTWYARKSAIPSLVAQAQKKVLFMRHVGVLSLSVGDTVILEQEEETDLSSALIQAITADCTEAVEVLLFLGADPKCSSKNETTPLIFACWKNSIRIAKLLLGAGVDVNAQVSRSNTALKVVCSFKIPNKDLVELLVQFGAQFVIPGEKMTALSIATIYGHTDIVQYLVSEGAPVNALNEDGITSLMCAYRNKHSEIAHILLTHGADPNMQDHNNTTALHSACYNQMTVGVELLLAHGADPSLRGIRKATPLIIASVKESGCIMDPSILILLLSAGADPNAQNDEGSTALIIASHCGYKDGITVLLNAGANVNIQNEFGSTALHGAALNGFLSISELLLASGAQASLIDTSGKTPLDYALDNNHHDVCQLLLANIDTTAVTERIPTEQEPKPQRSTQHSSASSTLDQLRYALEYPLSPADTIKHHQADEEGEKKSAEPK